MDPDTKNNSIHVSNQTSAFTVNEMSVRTICRAIMTELGVGTFHLSVNFIPEDEVQSLNKKYREKNYATDVLSFPQSEFSHALTHMLPHKPSSPSKSMPSLLGDLAICPSVAEQNARSIGHGLDRESAFLLLHGILHLCGHDHEELGEEEVMTNEQRYFMNFFESQHAIPLWKRCLVKRVA
jgi:probable rRNA maturation factor